MQNQKLGDMIYNYRKAHNISLESLSQKIGTSANFLSDLEHNRYLEPESPKPSVELLTKLANEMGCEFTAVLDSCNHRYPIRTIYSTDAENSDPIISWEIKKGVHLTEQSRTIINELLDVYVTLTPLKQGQLLEYIRMLNENILNVTTIDRQE